MAQILLVEDDGSYASELKEALREHIVIRAYSYNSAIGLMRKYNREFDCIILDLNIDPNGLSENQKEEYSPVHGILVLDKICEGKLPEESDDSKRIWEKTIIHSGYTSNFDFELEKFASYKSLTLIPKGGASIFDVINKVNEIIKKNVKNG